jgi:hypothetical protein
MPLQPRLFRGAPIVCAALLFSGLTAPQADAAQVKLRWDYTASGAAGFVLYCGPASRTYRTRVDVGNTDTYTLSNLPEGATTFCAVTAYDPAKTESVYSNELQIYVPKSTPAGIVPVPRPVPVPLPVPHTNLLRPYTPIHA